MIANLTKRLIEKLRRKEYRDAYVSEHVRTGIALQIRALREQRGMRQGELATALDKPQSVVNRLEDPDYGRMSISTLLEVARAFDVALNVRYISYHDFLRLNDNLSPEAMQVASFDPSQLETPNVPVSTEDVPLPLAPEVAQSVEHIVPLSQHRGSAGWYVIPVMQNAILSSRGYIKALQTPKIADADAIIERDKVISEQRAEIIRLKRELQSRATTIIGQDLPFQVSWHSQERPQ